MRHLVLAIAASCWLAAPAAAQSDTACFDPKAEAVEAMRSCGELMRLRENQGRLAEIQARIGTLFEGAFEFENAAAAYRKASELQPNNPFYAVAIPNALASANQFPAAHAAAEAAVQRFPSYADAYAARGRAQLGQLNYDAAIADLGRALEISGTRIQRASNTLHDRAKALIAKGKPAEALADLNAAIQASPGHFGAMWTRADLYRSMGNHAAALADYSALISRVDGPFLRSGRAQAYLGLGRKAEAFADFAAGLAIDPNNTSVLSARAWANYQAQNYADAIADAERALAASPNEFNPMFTACAARTTSGLEPAKAVETCGRLINATNDAQTRGLRGVAFLRLSRWKEAEADFAQSAAGLPNNALAHMGHAIALSRQGRTAEASAAKETAVRLDPQIIEAFEKWMLTF